MIPLKWPVTRGQWPAKTSLMAFAVGLTSLVGCQQKMADQPGHRPYEQSSLFAHKQSARPLEAGVIHRDQPLTGDPLVTWLTEKGKAPKHTANYEQWLNNPGVDRDGKPIPPLSAEAKKELLAQALQPGSPNDPENFVNELPFTMTHADFERGQKLYIAICAECHGGAGHANGKIPERGFLRPPSYHTDPDGKARDWSKYVTDEATGIAGPDYTGNPQGTSRGFYKYGLEVPLKNVPIGYIYQVIYWGYGGMGSHETQLPNPADRWRVAAYVRALQLSQAADATKLPDAVKQSVNNADKPKAEAKKAEDKH
jgi:mono/diheme cytochrome c family protein